MKSFKSLYSSFIYFRLLEATMARPSLLEIRKECLSLVQGEILEIGFGTGINLECYPAHVKKISAIDTNETLPPAAQKRAKYTGISVNFTNSNAEKLPFDDNTFDSVVSTFTFCSIHNTTSALREIYRVLKPGGHLFFLEHGLSPDKWVRMTQNFLTPLFNLISENLNRDIVGILNTQPFKLVAMEQFYYKDAMKITGYFYKGVAEKIRKNISN